VITMNNPPVNGLGLNTRQAIVAGLEKALADDQIKAIILTGAGKAFSGGADIKEFGSPKAVQEPNLLSVISAIENATKPVIAAVHTVAMGGGLELALGCHYRMAAPGCDVALPEDARAADTSTDTILACACGERTNTATSAFAGL
jgi:3-hydroxyacyl-CoA dehydrogenase